MPSGFCERELLFERKPASPDGKKVTVYRTGPFFEIEVSGVSLGKVRKTTNTFTEVGITRKLEVGQFEIILSPKEAEIIDNVNAERETQRNMSYEEKLVERQTVKQKIKSERQARFHEALQATPAMQDLNRALELEGTPKALPIEELNKIKGRASTCLFNRYLRGLVGELKYANEEITDINEAAAITMRIPLTLNTR
jgi:hypothetical protein